jgi:hypothetical protein
LYRSKTSIIGGITGESVIVVARTSTDPDNRFQEYLPSDAFSGEDKPKDRRASIKAIHKANGLPGNAGQRFDFRSIMKIVGQECGLNDAVASDVGHPASQVRDPLVVYWSTCSGMTHGYSWARFGTLQKAAATAREDDPAAEAHARLYASLENVMSLVEAAVFVLDHAWNVHKARRSARPSSPDPTPYNVGVVHPYAGSARVDPWRRRAVQRAPPAPWPSLNNRSPSVPLTELGHHMIAAQGFVGDVTPGYRRASDSRRLEYI